jgi:hypothetical protein
MTINDLDAVLVSAISIALGVGFGAIINKYVNSRGNNWLILFYTLASILLAGQVALTVYFGWDKITSSTYSLALWVTLIGCIIFLLWVSIFKLRVKSIYNANKLDPIINNFTRSGDRDSINLFGGDLNFFGESSIEIDQNEQYKFLKAMNFRRIFILCSEPNNNQDILSRYGKILHDIPNVELRFYKPPEEADLKIRGRMIKVQNVVRLLIYTKIKAGVYQAIESDTANSNGALYQNLWKLIWAMARIPSEDEVALYKKCFLGR